MIKSVYWLNEHLDDRNLILLDASLEAKKPRQKQIPEARFFDLRGRFSDKTSKFPNTMPSAIQFEKEARALGINNESTIVVYDNMGIYSAPRVWYMLKSMGHKQVYVLDGGLPEWESSGYQVIDIQDHKFGQGNFLADFNATSFKSTKDIENNIDSKAELLVDARASERFNGTSPEPRKELKSGCIKGSINIPFSDVLENGKFKDKSQLEEIFKDHKPMIFSCGSGLTACITLLAAEIVNSENEKSVYDGSWTEWAITNGLLT